MDPLDELYGLPLAEFVPARDALAKAGDRSIKKLRKPSVAAWAVNQVVRKPGLKPLLKAGDALIAAQEALLSGSGDGRTLRAARSGVDDAVGALRAAAAELRDEDGKPLTAATLDRVADTLHAVALDEGAREQVAEGRLERELQRAGLGLGGMEAFAATPAPRARPAADAEATKKAARGTGTGAPVKRAARKGAKAEDDAAAAAAAAAEREREEAQRAAAEKAAAEKLARERKAAEAELARARKAADRAAKALIAAQTRRQKAAEALEAADEELSEANTDADEAAEAVAEAESALADLDRP